MFVGRDAELQRLKRLLDKPTASLIAVTGRRRIGKSKLLEEFAKNFERSFIFSGLPPTEGVEQVDQKQEFAHKLCEFFDWPELNADSWSKLFSRLTERVTTGSVLVVLDEVSWMAENDKLFMPQLKNAWDLKFKKNDKLVLAVCGSVSSWVEENLLNSTGFVGRVSETIRLRELNFSACREFWGEKKLRIYPKDILSVLSVTGGVPRYLEEIRSSESAEINILNLCFSESGFLFSEFERLFSDLFQKKQARFRKILRACVQKHLNTDELAKKLKRPQSGALTKDLQILVDLGFLKRDFIWGFGDAKNSKLSKYRLSDNYCRFYLKYIEPNKARIEAQTFPDKGVSFLPGMESILGLQFENLILNNRKTIFKLLSLESRDIIQDGPFFQTKTKHRTGLQIDYLIQSRFNTLYLCEIKFRNQPLGTEVINEVSKKLKSLQIPKNFSLRPVLISAGPVSEQVLGERFFDKVISVEDLMA